MNKQKRKKVFRWIRWILLALLLLPVASLIMIKLTGSMKMRKSDDEILGLLHSYTIKNEIDTVKIGNRNIVYLRTSKGEKKEKDAIIFIHGSPGSMDDVLDYMSDDSLLDKADLIAYDRPGYGHSDFGKSMPSLRAQASVLRQVMNELGYNRYWLIGHSYGGSVIIQAMIDNEAKVAGIGIIAGSVIYDMEPVGSWRKWIDLPFIRILLPFVLRVSNDELMSLRIDLRMIDDDWNEITVPVSLMHGTKDILVPFDNLELAKQKLTHSDTVRTLVFEGENHFIWWTHKDQIIGEILALMKE